MKKKEKSDFITLLLVLGCVAVVAAIFVPSFINARSRGSNDTACRSNLKNIGTAMEMYSTDWSGKYPESLSILTPNYLKTIPVCPVSNEMRYRAVFGPGVGYNLGGTDESGKKYEGFQDYYLVWCEGQEHKKYYDGFENFPQYDGIQGMIRSPEEVSP